jgi:hypothetical protein
MACPALSFKGSILEGERWEQGRSIKVRVVTGSSKPRVEEASRSSFRVYVSAAPEKGRANAQMLKALSKHMGVPRSSISIVRGHSSREKLVRLSQI